MHYINRSLEPYILKAADQFPVLVLTGPRQTGKTTLLKHLFSSYEYHTLDDPIKRRICREDPALFLDSLPLPCIIDEIQYAPELLPYIKMYVDRHRDRTGQFILTGSQLFSLMKNVDESLAGRAAVFELLGLSLKEYPCPANLKEFYLRLFLGSYPDVIVHGVDKELYYRSYIQTYLERDLRQLSEIRDLDVFQDFLELIAGRVGNLLNISELGRILGISQPTAARWISFLENSRIIYLLRPYYRNFDKRIIKSPKVYFTDTGLLTTLLRYPDSQTAAGGTHGGALFENFVVAEYLKKKLHERAPFELYFFRDNHGNEIDLVLDSGSSVSLREIKSAKTIRPSHYKTLEKMATYFPGSNCAVISLYEEALPLSKIVRNIPWNRIPEDRN
jgi:predicted AAA+ superfamily ATPase